MTFKLIQNSRQNSLNPVYLFQTLNSMKFILCIFLVSPVVALASPFELYFDENDERIVNFVNNISMKAIRKAVIKINKELGELPVLKLYNFKSDEDYEEVTGHKVPFDTYIGMSFDSSTIGIILKEDVPKKFNQSLEEFYSKVILHEAFHSFTFHHKIEFPNECISEGLAVSYADQWFSVHKIEDKRFFIKNINLSNIFSNPEVGYDFRRFFVDYCLLHNLNQLSSKALIIKEEQFKKHYVKSLRFIRNAKYETAHDRLVSYISGLVKN